MDASNNQVDLILFNATESASKEHICLNCKFSYFQEINDSGLCHNENQVKGHMYPKVVNEFHHCKYWEKKCLRKEK